MNNYITYTSYTSGVSETAQLVPALLMSHWMIYD